MPGLRDIVIFQSTPPAWGATSRPFGRAGHPQYFNPRPPHGERRGRRKRKISSTSISIHAPRMGSDNVQVANTTANTYFNPRPPHGERLCIVSFYIDTRIFQSTPPAWGATPASLALCIPHNHFNPRPPHGERRRTS